MKKEKLISYLVIIGIILSIPSVEYLIRNAGNISGYSGEYFYIIENASKFFTKCGAIIYAWCLLLMFIIYIKLIKRSDSFKSIKTIILSAIFVGLAFSVALPNTSKDVFFYMGNGRVIDKYGKNPYLTTVSDVGELDKSDQILKTVGSQSNYNFVYGPVFLTICGLINKISFSSVSVFLYEFKILNFISYLLTIYLIYKLTGKKKLTICYAFNPLVLLEVLVNVHNDILVLLFALIGISFIKEAEKCREKFVKSELIFICGLMFLVISACIKYITILILPFVILYRLRNEKVFSKIIVGIAYLLVFFGIFSLTYAPYFDSLSGVFSGAMAQSGKLKDSIYMIIAQITSQDSQIVSIAYSIGFFTLLYIFIIRILMQFLRKNNFKTMMENSYSVLFSTIFLGLTNLTSWYLIWLFISVFWTNGKKLKNLIWIGFLYELTYVIFYLTHSDSSRYQVWILPFIGICMIIRQIRINRFLI